MNLSITNKIALISLITAIVGTSLAFRSKDSSAETEKGKSQRNNISINGNSSIGGDLVGGNKTINNGVKGTNYLEEGKDKKEIKFEKIYLPKNDGEFKYKVELEGKLKLTENFKPFRVEMYGNDPMVYALSSTLNINKPFYEVQQDLMFDWLGASKPIYDVPKEGGGYYSGYPQLIKITNITDYGEDIVFKNILHSTIRKTGDADRVIAVFSMGGSENYLKLDRKIILKDGEEKIKFKDADFITLRSGETIVIKIPYIAKSSGKFLPIIDLSFKLAGSKGKLSIEAPEILVPKIIGWVDTLVDLDMEKLSDKKNTVLYAGYVGAGEALSYWSESKGEYIPFSFSLEKFSREDLKFIGKANLRYYRNEVFALKGAKFKSRELTQYFKEKFPESYKPSKFASEYDVNRFSDIEKYNIEMALEIEQN